MAEGKMMEGIKKGNKQEMGKSRQGRFERMKVGRTTWSREDKIREKRGTRRGKLTDGHTHY